MLSCAGDRAIVSYPPRLGHQRKRELLESSVLHQTYRARDLNLRPEGDAGRKNSTNAAIFPRDSHAIASSPIGSSSKHHVVT